MFSISLLAACGRQKSYIWQKTVRLKDDDFMKEISTDIQRFLDMYNTKPLEEFDYLSSRDMYLVLNDCFMPGSPIQFHKAMSAESVDRVPYFKLFLSFLHKLSAVGELKLTKVGNLPTAWVKALYEEGWVKQAELESGLFKLSKETDSLAINSLKIIGILGKLVKKRNNKLSLTKKGASLLIPGKEVELFKIIFESHFHRFHWGYFDGFPPVEDLQYTAPFSLYLLLRYGKEPHSMGFYAEKMYAAFPTLADHFPAQWNDSKQYLFHCYFLRLFDRFLLWYGFIDSAPLLNQKSDNTVHATKLFFQTFEIEPENWQFDRAKGEA
jgi:hypothetical protein